MLCSLFSSRFASSSMSLHRTALFSTLLRQRNCHQAVADIWNPELYEKDAPYIYQGAAAVFEYLQPRKGQRILDLGCGTGEHSKSLESFGCKVVGIDNSPAMIEVSTQRGLDARLLDGHNMSFKSEFDAVFSNYALHWMSQNPKQVIKNVKRSLKPNGTFVGAFGGKGTIDTIIKPLELVLARRGISFHDLNPWFFPSRGEYWTLLESEGFQVIEMSLRDRDVAVSHSPSDWLEIFGGSFFRHINNSEKQEIYKELEITMKPVRVNKEGQFVIDYMELQFVAKNGN